MIGTIKITSKQADKLGVKKGTNHSECLEKSCLLITSNKSYQRGEEDLEKFTGIKVSHSTLQRMVNKQEWLEIEVSEEIEEMSLDGGMVRLRTPLKEASEWREYRTHLVFFAITLTNKGFDLKLAFC